VRHEIDSQRLGARGDSITGPIESCVHCGFCLSTCPTYLTLGDEMNSPRGRILLIKEMYEGRLDVELAQPHLDNCLGCQACVTACPSGVEYGELITAYRMEAEPSRRRPLGERFKRRLLLETLPYPTRFRRIVRLALTAGPLNRLAPPPLRPMLDLLPESLPAPTPLPPTHAARGRRRGRVALLAGCAQQVLQPDIGWAALRVLARNGVEVVVPPRQGCCGALAMHTGAGERAIPLAERNLDAFPDDVDAIVTTAAGCGSGLHEYPLLLAGTDSEPAAKRFAARVMDVTAYLDKLGVDPPPALARPLTVAYHDACHLAHAQGVRDQPRRLLSRVPGVSVVDPREWEICCGSAGTYNVEKPALAAELGARKARNLTATGADLIATGNIGCVMQIRKHLQDDRPVPVLHTVQLLDRAYRRELG
jgi:glycolate oxidase iron-sulfur subunit